MPAKPKYLEQLCSCLIQTDFDNVYKLNLKTIDERLQLMKLAFSVFSIPFIVAAALLTSKAIEFQKLQNLSTIPQIIFVFGIICGISNFIILLRIIEVTSNHLRTVRAINSFRYLYSSILKENLKEIKWATNLPTDPKYPRSFEVTNWSGLLIFFIVFVNSFYITLGFFGLFSLKILVSCALFATIASLQYFLYYNKCKSREKLNRKPEDNLKLGKNIEI